MRNQKVSVISCYNKENILKDYLDSSIDNQNITVEKIYINNNVSKFKSAAEALNYGASIATGEYLIFAHQDIEFNDTHFIEKTIEYINEAKDMIVGIAGKKVEDFKIYSNMLHGPRKVKAGNYQILELVQVQTLDEVYIGMKKQTFEKLKFDDKVLTSWHLYGVDICLNAGKLGISSYVMPLEAYHLSTGSVDSSFYNELDKVINKYRSSYDVIATTCVNTKTTYLAYEFYKVKKKITDRILQLLFKIKYKYFPSKDNVAQ